MQDGCQGNYETTILTAAVAAIHKKIISFEIFLAIH
jgi:hypothetical protein